MFINDFINIKRTDSGVNTLACPPEFIIKDPSFPDDGIAHLEEPAIDGKYDDE